jgi:hypothetical protein
MDRDEVEELHFITSVDNLDSILEKGILSHNRAAKIPHTSVALPDVQDRRKHKSVPNGAKLHSYANIYLDARNPMLSYLLNEGHQELIIVRVSDAVLDIEGSVVTDGNAASDGTRFYPSPDGLSKLDRKLVFARYWTDEVRMKYIEKKRARCAELLVPNMIAPEHIFGCYVDTRGKKTKCQECSDSLEVTIHREIYFR